jgi:dTDP-4-dehydrorhamnose 3,5-epimerase
MAAGQAGVTVMKITRGSLAGVQVLEPRVFSDERGFFLEVFNQRVMREIGIEEEFVQDNHSFSKRNVLRGMHYQVQRAQGKLVRVVTGAILDVVVDLRRSSPTFGGWEAVVLSEENHKMIWVPTGFAHGFRVLSDGANVLYKTTDFYFPNFEKTIAWNDPDLKIDWQLQEAPIVSAKDKQGIPFKHAEVYA